uniref:Uncharacterized protein n=1 Tax=Kalanchoe fedtschenkoi TaxID=63787 RepID=A0A7N0TSF4_KALFE
MTKVKRFSSANRAWSMLRLAMLWARKGGMIKRKLVMDLHLASKYIKALKRNNRKDSIRYSYGEHELSFDKTPMIHVKMYRPTSMRFKLPCFTPEMVDFDCDECFSGHNYAIEDASGGGEGPREEMVEGDEIDERAEKFIAEFYAQMKLQRQMSRIKIGVSVKEEG